MLYVNSGWYSILQSKNSNGLENLLRIHAGIDISDRAIKEMIQHVKEIEIE